MLKKILAVVLAVVIIGLVVDLINPSYGFFSKVNAGYVGVTTTFGKVGDEVLDSGLHMTNFFTRVVPMDVREKKGSISISAFSSDIQEVEILESVNYSISKDGARRIYQDIGTNYYDLVIMPRLLENTKTVIARYSAESLIANREELSVFVLAEMQEDMEKYGITIISVSIENIDFSDAFTEAVERKQVATQDLLTTETLQAQLTIEASAEAERAAIAVDAEAYQVVTRATAEAEANSMIADSLTPELVQYYEIERWNGELPQTYVGNTETIPILNVDSNVE